MVDPTRRALLAAAAAAPLVGCHRSPPPCTGGWVGASAGTRAMSGGNWNSAGRPSSVRKRSPAGSAVGTRNGRRLARMNPHSPKLGTWAWYGVVVRPAASRVCATVQ